MDPKTSLILYGIILIIILAALYNFFKLAFKIVLALSIVSAVVIGMIGFFVVRDVMDMKNNLPNSDNLFLFHSGGDVLIAFNAQFSGEYMPQPVSQSKLDEIDGFYKEKDYDKILEDNYKIFIYDIGSFSTDGEIEVFKDQNFEKGFLVDLIKSDNTVDRLVDEMMAKQNIDPSLKESLVEQITTSIGDDQKLRASIVFIMFFDEMSDDPLFLFRNYKDGRLIIYPRTATFKFINSIPISMFKNALRFAKDKLSDENNNPAE